MRDKSAFTVIEILVAICVLLLVGILGFSNIHDLEARNRDNQLKTSVNAVQYQLQAFYQTNKYYPKDLTSQTLPGLDPALLKDPQGTDINQFGSNLTYDAKDCKQNQCQSFTLTASLEKEPPYTRTSSDKLN